MPINTKYLKKYTFLRYNSFAKLNLYKIFFAVIYRLLRFGEKKECRRQRFSISMDALFKIFSKNELKNVLTKFHDFIINLNYLALSSLTRNRFKFVYSFYRVFGMKCPLDCL